MLGLTYRGTEDKAMLDVQDRADRVNDDDDLSTNDIDYRNADRQSVRGVFIFACAIFIAIAALAFLL